METRFDSHSGHGGASNGDGGAPVTENASHDGASMTVALPAVRKKSCARCSMTKSGTKTR